MITERYWSSVEPALENIIDGRGCSGFPIQQHSLKYHPELQLGLQDPLGRLNKDWLTKYFGAVKVNRQAKDIEMLKQKFPILEKIS